MEFLHVTLADDFRAEEIYRAYTAGFPEDERRNAEQYRQLFRNPAASVTAVLNGQDFVGYYIGWQLSGCIFLEHFEIFAPYRHQSMGSEVLSNLFKDYSKIVLETEPEDFSEEAAQRINFYKKNGFITIDENYTQPSYAPEKLPVPLWLMCNCVPENIPVLKEEIYDVVYGR